MKHHASSFFLLPSSFPKRKKPHHTSSLFLLPSSFQKGSALLIVIGMLAFMVISAVAFSAFMRYSRLPSSYLRRTSSSRHLVKAALAEAIDIVDAAVADNPHPGVGTGSIQYPREAGRTDSVRNTWHRHVFIGSNICVSAADTISTLTLEGLAYLPPALINEARYYSRHSLGATWHAFGYDCGRYAFCAVDVSDHFNVNKIPADLARGSSPENRLSLAYVFENDAHTGYTVPPATWDSFMEEFVTFDVKQNVYTPAKRASAPAASSGSKLPLVSLADLNLALNDKLGDFRLYFPFANVLSGGGDEFVTASAGPVAEMIKHMNFVTDGYFPPAGGSGDDDDYDLADEQYQPFRESDLRANNGRVIRRIIEDSSIGSVRLRNAISPLGLVNLWDYLDEDNVPVSLAVPSTERAPMVCGIGVRQTSGSAAIKFSMKMTDPDGNQIQPSDLVSAAYAGASKRTPPMDANDTRNVKYVKTYTMDQSALIGAIRGIAVKAVVAYPFRRGVDIDDPDSFTIDGHAEFFFSVGTMPFRTGNVNDLLHIAGDTGMATSQYNGDGVLHVPFQSQSCTFSNVTKEDDAVKEFDFMLGTASDSGIRSALANPVMKVTWIQAQESWEPDPVNRPGQFEWRNTGSDPTRESATCALPPLSATGDRHASFASDAAVLSYLRGGSAVQATLNMAVWLRVKNGDGKTVDLVPASLSDDQAFNSINNYQSLGAIGNQMCGSAYPVMRFAASPAFDFKDTSFDSFSPVDVAVSPTGLLCGDPRWNWAPEQWFAPAGVEVSKQTWLSNCGKGTETGGGRKRDRDIFMATSDAGYMQSVYELAFLPRLTANLVNGGGIWGIMEQPGDGRTAWATALGGCRNSELMWMTHNPFARPRATRDDFDQVGFISDGGGARITPYSSSENVVIAAFANTPESWWSASANTQTGVAQADRTATKFNKKYAFSAMNPKAKFDWQDLKRVAAAFVSKMQTQTTIDGWMDAYDDLWALDGDDGNKLMGAELEGDTDDLYDVDRKFLYGYWRDSFAVKQQLFLIFVRAEPMMMGGGAIGQTPPQLGARAVALVWRNPYPGSKSYAPAENSVPANAPHQTRILFYRQFD